MLDYPLSRMFYDLHREPALADAYRADRNPIIARYAIAEPVADALRRDDVAFLARRTNPFLLRYYFFVTGMSEGDFIGGLQANRDVPNG
jgi:hypothetical protein